MHNINNYIFFLFFFSSSLFTVGQINVFENHCISFDPIEFNDMPNNIETHCTELPKNEQGVSEYNFNETREIKAATFIEFSDEMELTPSGTGSLTAYIEEPSFEVVAYVNDLSAVGKLEKLELGIKLPLSIQEGIDNFLNNAGSNEINPYLSSSLKVSATFERDYTVAFGQPVTQTVKRDGFFTKDVERDISGFEGLYDHPLANDTEVVTGTAYQELGGGWTVTDSEYPFRIRFAPPAIGEWRCRIKIEKTDAPNVISEYESPEFQFKVVNSTKKNYLKVDNNKRFLKQDGESFRPIGVNYPWPSGNGFPLRSLVDGNRLVYEPQYHGQLPPIAHYEQYLRMMDTLAMNGVNYFRMIMNPFTLDIEYEKLGDYTDRMHIAEEMDLILERAADNDLLIHWNCMLHNTLQINGFYIDDWDWTDENKGTGYCYKKQIDGVDTPLDFLTNDTAKKYYKERLRYIVARWGYSSDIAMFEHFSEIDQVGTEHDENAEAISFTNQYAGNEAVFNEWHGEMSWYLKEVLEIPQLLTLSYTTEYDEDLDHSFWHGNIDVINLNNYNYNTSDIHGYHRRNIRKKIAETGDDYNDGHHVWGNYKKPLFFSEMGAHEVWNCDNNVETRRSIWQSYFWGISGGLEWHLPADLSIYQRVDDFISGVDLEGGKWHSGMMKLDNQDRWEYKKAYRDDCIRDDELADVVYLRSGDKEKAFGVITNRRANYYTLGEGECNDSTVQLPAHSGNNVSGTQELVYTSLLRFYGSLNPMTGDNRLRIRNMKLAKEYKIKYYNPNDLVNSVKEETRWGPQLTLEFPTMGGSDSLDIILFEVFPMGEDFKSMENDTTNLEDIESRISKNEENDTVSVYPNPNDGKFMVLIENYSGVSLIRVLDNLGKIIDTRTDIKKINHFNSNTINSGVYSIEVVFENRVVRKKMIVN